MPASGAPLVAPKQVTSGEFNANNHRWSIDGSKILLKKLEEDYDPSDAVNALQRLHRSEEAGQMLTGLVFLKPQKKSFISLLQLTDEPLNTLPLERTRPSREALDKIMKDLM